MAQNELHKLSIEESRCRYRRGVYNPPKCRQNLLNLLPEGEEEETPMMGHVKVYLRIKPVRCAEHASIKVKNESTLITCPPEDGKFPKHVKLKTSAPLGFQFSKIFGPETTQKEIFEGAVLPSIDDFLKGKDALLFAYGTSSAGKTFTMQGTEKHPGVIPRALDVLFNSLQDKIMTDVRYKLASNYTIEMLSDEDAQAEFRLKEAILKWNPQSMMEGSRYIQSILHDTRSTESSLGESSTGSTSFKNGSGVFFIPASLKRERNSILLPADQKGVQYSIWVSFAEVYNEAVFDLLDFLPGKGPPSNLKRPKLNLVTDNYGNTSVQGLKEVCVSSGDEACKVMLLGKCNLHFAATKLNHKSSRSHCVFTVKLLRMSEDSSSHYEISSLSFCDLAGAERLVKSENVGERLKETGNINTSLLVLGRCLKALRKNQSDGRSNTRVPFRESKLTRMFQNALTGSGNIAMIVNVSPNAMLFDETLHVLKYAAIAQEIVLMPVELQLSRLNTTKNRFSILAAKHREQHQERATDMNSIAEASTFLTGTTSISLFEVIEILKQENADLLFQLEEEKRESLEKQDEVRRFVCTSYKALLKKMELKHEKTVKEIKSDLDEYYSTQIYICEREYQSKIKKLQMQIDSEKKGGEKPLEEAGDTNSFKSEIDKLTSENSELKAKLEKSIANLREVQEEHERTKGKEDESLQLKNENATLNFELEVAQKKVKELEETLQDGYIEFSTLMEKVINLETELNNKNKEFAQMELNNAQLQDEFEVSDKLLQEANQEIEMKDAHILELEKVKSKEVGTIGIQCDLSIEKHRKEMKALENSMVDVGKKLKSNEEYYEEIINTKDSEISNMEKAFKSLLNQKNDLQNQASVLKVENSELTGRIILVEKELTESNKMLREVCVENRESKNYQMDDSEAKKESIQMLDLLKEELELKRSVNERLLNETQALRDVVDCKEKEMQSFQENQARILSNYELLLNKEREKVELHKREEKQLRALLQIGTPNKYEKKYESLNHELSNLKKTLSAVLCSECSSRIPLEDQGSHSCRDRSDVSNENCDPRMKTLRRRSKSETHLYTFDDSDDSDFVIDMDHSRKRKNHKNKTLGYNGSKEGYDIRHTMPLSVDRTPFKSSRRLLNPTDCTALSDLTGNMPIYPRTPADVIKRVLRPRK